MSITTCNRCGKIIHVAKNCMYCGAKIDRQTNSGEYTINENAYDAYNSLTELMESKEFVRAIEMANIVIKWMPTCSEAFWVKMLANNKCSDDAELVWKGISLRETPEFLNAIKYATNSELAVYKDIERVIDNVRKRLEEKVTNHEYTEKKALALIECQLKNKEQISISQKKVFSLWKEYENIERQIYTKEQDRALLTEEYRYILNNTKNETEQLISCLDKATECSEEDVRKYQVKLGTLQYQTEKTINEIKDFVQLHPWIEEINELNRRKYDFDKRIAEELTQLKKLTDDMKSMVTAVDKIEHSHKSIVQAVSHYDFEEAYLLIGNAESKEVFSTVGLSIFPPM